MNIHRPMLVGDVNCIHQSKGICMCRRYRNTHCTYIIQNYSTHI